jgi:hypothetical protein
MRSRRLRASIESAVPVATGFLRVTRYEFEIEKHAGGSQRVVREVMERGHAVAVLAYDPHRDVVVLANEFRPGCLVAGDDPFTDNLPAGGIAEGESVIEAATRELKEETGLELRNPIVVHPGAFASSGGYVGEDRDRRRNRRCGERRRHSRRSGGIGGNSRGRASRARVHRARTARGNRGSEDARGRVLACGESRAPSCG